MGRAMMYIASVFSQLERETIAERIRDNMHELSKTGRWLGGTTPTGYASESLSSVTVDGKVKKACKLKPIPEEIQLVKTIFEVFMETGSLSKTDQYLLEHRCVTKRGKQFTRFAIRGILTNPVYMIADETAYQYLKENNVDLFAERAEFDGEHGVMAYNRTLQRPGKANQIRPMEEWIVAVGKHPGIVAGSDWVRVQAMLDVNKSKSYRRPRSNVALLSGLLRCGECGDYMRPKLTNRKNAEGELIYTYMCSTKERSHGTVCSMKNCNGNTLDAKIIEEIRKLSADKETLTRLLAQTKKVISGSKEGYDAELALLREKHAETEDRIKRLVESLSVASDTSAKYVMEQIDALHQESETQQLRLAELEALTEQSRMLHQEFAFHQGMIESFASAVDSATLEEKRRLLRTIVKKVVSYPAAGADKEGHQRQQGGLRHWETCAAPGENTPRRRGPHQAAGDPLSVASDTSAKYNHGADRRPRSIRKRDAAAAPCRGWKPSPSRAGCSIRSSPSIRGMIESFASAVDSATLEEKRRLLRTIVKKMVWDGKMPMCTCLQEDGEADLPC